MSTAKAKGQAGAQLGSRLWAIIESAFTEVGALAERASDLSAAALDRNGTLASSDFQPLTPRITDALRRLGTPVQGLGIIVDANVLIDQPFWLSWIVLEEDGTIAHSHHVTNPNREDFYEYSLAEWMSTPRKTHAKAIAGPYVDYGGTDDYILTLSVPILASGRFLGVAAADIPLARVERLLAADLHAIQNPCAVLNAERRIVVSNSATLPVGALAEPRPQTHQSAFGDMGWSILTR